MWNKYSRKKESCVRKKEVGKRCGSLSGICGGGGMYWQLKMSYIKIEKDSKDFLQINKETCII